MFTKNKDSEMHVMSGLRVSAVFAALACFASFAMLGSGCSSRAHVQSTNKFAQDSSEDGPVALTPQDKALIQKMRTDPKSPAANNTAAIFNMSPDERGAVYREMVLGSMHRGSVGPASGPPSAPALPAGKARPPDGDQ